MVAQRKPKPAKEERSADDRPRVVTFAVLFGAVLAAVLIAAALSTDAPDRRPGRAAPPSADPQAGPPPPVLPSDPSPAALDEEAPAHRPAAPEFPPSTSGASTLEKRLASRALADLGRLGTSPGQWTAQLAILCDPSRVERLISDHHEGAGLHLLPAVHGGQSCFRLCWSRYPTRDEATRAADLPAALRRIAAQPLPKPIAELVE